MNTELTWQTVCMSSDETEALGEKIGQRLRGGEVIELISDLGGGKTTFVRGLARGAGSKDAVSSPSFTLSNEYQANDLRLYHMDFYRLNEPGIMKNELSEFLEDKQGVIIVEWARIIDEVLPAARLKIRIKVLDAAKREFTITYPPELDYLFPDNT